MLAITFGSLCSGSSTANLLFTSEYFFSDFIFTSFFWTFPQNIPIRATAEPPSLTSPSSAPAQHSNHPHRSQVLELHSIGFTTKSVLIFIKTLSNSFEIVHNANCFSWFFSLRD
jgi:hypothetical protein